MLARKTDEDVTTEVLEQQKLAEKISWPYETVEAGELNNHW